VLELALSLSGVLPKSMVSGFGSLKFVYTTQWECCSSWPQGVKRPEITHQPAHR
jgi:hypothetical protein